MKSNRVKILEVKHETEKAVLAICYLSEIKQKFETWIPKSVIFRKTIKPWFQQVIIARFDETWGPS